MATKKRVSTASNRSGESGVRSRLRVAPLALDRLNQGTVVGAAGLALLAFLVYWPALRGGFIFDDDILLTSQPLIKAADGLWRFWFSTESIDYWPVANSNLWLEWRLWGMNSTGYHITALALHILTAWSIWAALEMMSVPGSFVDALLFTVHPVNVETVAWIAQRKSLLALFFSVLSILGFLQTEATAKSNERPYAYWFSLLAFALALLSKASSTILPVTLALLIAWIRPLRWSDWKRLVPFAALATALTLVNLWFSTHGSAQSVRSAGFIERLLGAATAVWFYLYKALVPLQLLFVYPKWNIRTDEILWWLPLVAVVGLTVFLWTLRRGIGRAALFCWLHFCVALLPALGFVDSGFMAYSLVADHYQHFAILGVLVLASASWKIAESRWGYSNRAIYRGGAALVIALSSLLSWRQSALYANEATLYEATLRLNPQAEILHRNLGAALAESGRIPEAMQHYQQALQLNPKDADAENNLGAALYDGGHLREAIEHYEAAVRLNPNLVEAQNNLANALYKVGQPEKAIAHYEAAIARRPGFAQAHNNLAMALIAVGRLEEAIGHSRTALELQPTYAEAHYSLGLANLQKGQTIEAEAQFRQAVALRPNFTEARRQLESLTVSEKQGAIPR